MMLNNNMLIKSFFAVTLLIASSSTNIWGMYTQAQAEEIQAILDLENKKRGPEGEKTEQEGVEKCATCAVEENQAKKAAEKRAALDFWAEQVYNARKPQGFPACCSADCLED